MWFYDNGPKMILKVFRRQITERKSLPLKMKHSKVESSSKCCYDKSMTINKNKVYIVNNKMIASENKIN